jgi:hypothetical protein
VKSKEAREAFAKRAPTENSKTGVTPIPLSAPKAKSEKPSD